MKNGQCKMKIAKWGGEVHGRALAPPFCNFHFALAIGHFVFFIAWNIGKHD